MGGKRSAEPSGDAHGKATASGDGGVAQGGPSRKRRTQGQSVHGGAGSVEAGSAGQEESGSMLAPVTMCLSMRCDPSALDGRKTSFEAALEAAMRRVATEFGGQNVRVEWTRVGPSDDTLQRVLPLVLERLEPEGAAQCLKVCKTTPSPPPESNAPMPSLPLKVRPAHNCVGWASRPASAVVDLYVLGRVVPVGTTVG
jgi:hypothetical protein